MPSDMCFKLLEIASKKKNVDVNTTETLLAQLNGNPPGGNKPS
jgi:hypothetical protein